MSIERDTPAGTAGSRYSAAGERRKREILSQLRGAMVRRRRRRALGRAGAAGLVPLVAITGAVWIGLGRATPPPAPHPADAMASSDGSADRHELVPPAPTLASAQFDVVRTDAERVHALLAPPPTQRSIVVSIGDDELLATLSRAGTHCGIVRSGGRTVVTDNERGGELRTASMEDNATPVGGPGVPPGGGAI